MLTCSHSGCGWPVKWLVVPSSFYSGLRVPVCEVHLGEETLHRPESRVEPYFPGTSVTNIVKFKQHKRMVYTQRTVRVEPEIEKMEIPDND